MVAVSVPSVIDTRSVSNNSINYMSAESLGAEPANHAESEDFLFLMITITQTDAHLLVQNADLHARVPSVFLKNGGERPALKFAPASHDSAGPMPAHVATHQRRECGRLK